MTEVRFPVVWVLHIEHRFGHDASVFRSEAGAKAAVAGFVRQWWHELADYDDRLPTEPPDDDQQAVDLYFEVHHDESYLISTANLEP